MRAIFLDRDGVICKNRVDHVKNWAEFEFILLAKEGLLTLTKLNMPIVVITNQAAIERGLTTTAAVEEVHERMVAEITAFGGRIDRVYYCPSDNSPCRKPEPGMLLQAADDLSLDLAGSYLVGDAATDLQAGQRVGCHTFLVLTGRGAQQLPHAAEEISTCFTVARSLKQAAEEIVRLELHTNNHA